jgi:hypothetical protein
LDELKTITNSECTIATVPEMVARRGDRWQAMNDHPQSLEPLMEMHKADRASGLMDAPWPPVYPKQPDEPPRVAPSRAKKPPAGEAAATANANDEGLIKPFR